MEDFNLKFFKTYFFLYKSGQKCDFQEDQFLWLIVFVLTRIMSDKNWQSRKELWDPQITI